MNEKQKRFAEYYAQNPNAAEAAKAAGYSEKTARSQGQRLLTNVDIKNYIRELQDKAAEDRILSLNEIKAFWSDVVNDTSQKTSDRIKASELLAKSAGAFLPPDDEKEDDGKDDVIIYLPEMMSEEECTWKE